MVTESITRIINLGDAFDGDGLRVEVYCDGDGTPLCIDVTIDGVRATFDDVSAAQIERLGDALRRVRWGNGDFRGCCADHGYHERISCPECEEVDRG